MQAIPLTTTPLGWRWKWQRKEKKSYPISSPALPFVPLSSMTENNIVRERNGPQAIVFRCTRLKLEGTSCPESSMNHLLMSSWSVNHLTHQRAPLCPILYNNRGPCQCANMTRMQSKNMFSSPGVMTTFPRFMKSLNYKWRACWSWKVLRKKS